MGGEWVGGVGPCVGDVGPQRRGRGPDLRSIARHAVGRPHAADGFPCVGDVAPTYDIPVAPRVGDVAPTYDIPVGRPHVADTIIFPVNSLLS